MNYIQLINAFWAKAELDDLKGNDVSVYFALLKYCNKLNWLNPFVCHWDIVCQYAKVSKNSYYKSVETLSSKGYIEYHKGKKNQLKPKIVILKLENKKGTIKEQNGEQHEEQNEEQKGNLYKLLNKQTIKLINSNYKVINKNLSKWINEDIRINMPVKKFDFFNALIEIGVEEQTAKDWLTVRKNKKASNTKTAFIKIKKQINKTGLTANEVIEICASKDWKGFESEWINKKLDKNEKNEAINELSRRIFEEQENKRSINTRIN